jgi:hypothetical protein
MGLRLADGAGLPCRRLPNDALSPSNGRRELRLATRALPCVSVGRCGAIFEIPASVGQNRSGLVGASFRRAVNHKPLIIPGVLSVWTLGSGRRPGVGQARWRAGREFPIWLRGPAPRAWRREPAAVRMRPIAPSASLWPPSASLRRAARDCRRFWRRPRLSDAARRPAQIPCRRPRPPE